MKKYLSLLGLGAMAVTALAPERVCSQTTASTNVRVYARVVRPICVNSMEEINFGAIYSSPVSGTATITPDLTTNSINPALRSLSGLTGVSGAQGAVDATADLDDADGISQGLVRVCGESGMFFTLTAPGPTFIQSGPNLMLVDNVTFAPRLGGYWSSPTGQLSGSLSVFTPADGEEYLNVGGTLHVAGNQAPGIYAGWMMVFASYN